MVYADDTWTVAGEPSLLFGESTWDPTVIANDMTDTDGDGIFTWEKTNVVVSTNTSIAFKVVKNHHWNSQENPSEAYPADNYTHTLYAATYDITITFNSSTHDVQFSAIRHITSVKLAGSFNSWSESEGNITLSKVGDTNVYTCDVDTWTDDVEFKLIANNDWLGYNNVTSITAPDGWVVQSDETNKNFKLKHNSLPTNYKSYTITATWTPNEYSNQGWAIEIEGKEAKINTVKLSGSFNGWKGADADCIILSKVGDTNVYTCDVAWTEETQFQLIANDLWMKYTDVGEANIDAPDGWVVKSDETYKNFLLKGKSVTHYLSYTITATWTPNKYANQGWTIAIAGKDPQPINTYTVTFVNGKKWDEVAAYVWNSTPFTEIEGGWPGKRLSKTGTVTFNGEKLDVYTYTLETYDAAPEKIIFNNNKSGEGEKKTADLDFVDGKEYTDAVTFIPVYAVIGSNNDESDKAIFSGIWDAANTTDLLTEVSDGKWKISFENANLTEAIKFKVIKKAYLEATTVETYYPAGDNLTISDTGYRNIYINFDGTSVSVTNLPATETFTISAAGWATAKATYAVNFTGVEGIEAYTATVSGNTVTLHKVGPVPAGTALVLKGETKEVPTIESADDVSNDLHWYTTYTVNDEHRHVYGLVKGTDGKAQFTRVNNGQVITNKAILELVPSASRELKVVFDDETTGISQIENTQPATKIDGAIYNLNGQRVMNPGKGLYIINGKKVIMK